MKAGYTVATLGSLLSAGLSYRDMLRSTLRDPGAGRTHLEALPVAAQGPMARCVAMRSGSPSPVSSPDGIQVSAWLNRPP